MESALQGKSLLVRVANSFLSKYETPFEKAGHGHIDTVAAAGSVSSHLYSKYL